MLVLVVFQGFEDVVKKEGLIFVSDECFYFLFFAISVLQFQVGVKIQKESCKLVWIHDIRFCFCFVVLMH